jgi:hypothetical protein
VRTSKNSPVRKIHILDGLPPSDLIGIQGHAASGPVELRIERFPSASPATPGFAATLSTDVAGTFNVSGIPSGSETWIPRDQARAIRGGKVQLPLTVSAKAAL